MEKNYRYMTILFCNLCTSTINDKYKKEQNIIAPVKYKMNY